MRNIIFVLLIFSIFSCEKKNEKTDANNLKDDSKTEIKSDNNTRESQNITVNFEEAVNSLKKFRQAVYQNDNQVIKEFIDFPVNSDEIWYLTGEENHKKAAFTEKDFDKYQSKIFDKMFIQALLKVKTKELAEKGKYTTEDLKDGDSTYEMSASFEKPNTLKLSLGVTNYIENEDWSEEYGIIYIFEILKNGNIKFRNIQEVG